MMSFRGAYGDEKSSRLCLNKAVTRRFLASLEMTKTLIIYLTVYY
jgi:hypothetical protein